MFLPDDAADVVHPRAPRSLEESGLGGDLVLQLVLKTLLFAGELTGAELTRRLGLAFPVLGPVIDLLKAQRHCEISGGAMLGAAAYKYRITDAGRARATLFLEQNHYTGVAPVPFRQYQEYMRGFAERGAFTATRERVRAGFSHLVLSQRVLDQVGPAINSGHSMFVYGPPGNGKTVISQAVGNLLAGDIAIPYALEVEGSIIQFFDPVSHSPVPASSPSSDLELQRPVDQRWVRCRRPIVMVGGELTLEQLELSYSSAVGYYRAPIQAIANGGVLVIDDFGRQACPPRALLNRWIVPLENGVDYLALQTGQKIDFPFMAMIVFATNIAPAELVDEAFLRRIQYKVHADSPTEDDFLAIFERCCQQREVEFRPREVRRLLETYYRPRGIQLRGCQPRDLLDHAIALARYFDEPFELTCEALERACASYFLEERSPATTV